MSAMPWDQAIALAVVGGFITWKVLNWRDVRGDVALASFATLYSILYTYIRTSGSLPPQAVVILPAVYVAATIVFTLLYRLSPWHPLASYPGPLVARCSSLWLTYISFKGKRHVLLDELHAQYGPFLRIGPNALSINTPESGAQMYSTGVYMEKSEAYRCPGHLTAVALFFKQEKKVHQERRKLWNALFGGAGVSQLFPLLEQRTWELIQCIEARQARSNDHVVDLTECISHFAYDLMGSMVFGDTSRFDMMKKGDPMNIVRGGQKGMIVLDSAGQAPWLMDIIWHIPAGKELHRLQELAKATMETRLQRKEASAYLDLVSYWLKGSTVTRDDLDLEAAVAIQGGADTPSMTLAIAFYHLLAEPHHLQKLREELDAAFPDPLGPLPPAQLAALPYLDGVVNETLRLSATAFISRIVPRGGATVSGRFIPEGTVVAWAMYSQERNPDIFYPDPLNFHPERWIPNGMGPETRADKSLIYAFSAGPYVCVAKAFAYQMMRYIIARVVLTLDISAAKGFDSKAFADGIMNNRAIVLKKPLLGTVRRRDGVDLSNVM